MIFPVGIVVEFENSTDPNTVFPGTTWIVTQKGQVAVGAGDYWENGTKYTYTLGDTGGEVKHLITVEELAAHSHGASCSTDGNHNHSYSRTTLPNPDNAATGSTQGTGKLLIRQILAPTLTLSQSHQLVVIKDTKTDSHTR